MADACGDCARAPSVSPLTVTQLWRLGWRPGVEFRIVGACGHGRDVTPWPIGRGWWRRVPFYGEVQAAA